MCEVNTKMLNILKEMVRLEDWYGEDIPENSTIGRAIAIIAECEAARRDVRLSKDGCTGD